jgi:hypothetical protein
MYHEDVKVKNGETVSGIGTDYGYKITERHNIWDDARLVSVAKCVDLPDDG